MCASVIISFSYSSGKDLSRSFSLEMPMRREDGSILDGVGRWYSRGGRDLRGQSSFHILSQSIKRL